MDNVGTLAAGGRGIVWDNAAADFNVGGGHFIFLFVGDGKRILLLFLRVARHLVFVVLLVFVDALHHGEHLVLTVLSSWVLLVLGVVEVTRDELPHLIAAGTRV